MNDKRCNIPVDEETKQFVDQFRKRIPFKLYYNDLAKIAFTRLQRDYEKEGLQVLDLMESTSINNAS